MVLFGVIFLSDRHGGSDETSLRPPMGIEQRTFPLSFRLWFLIPGILFFSFGIYALAQVIWLHVLNASADIPTINFYGGVALSTVFAVLGALAIWTFFIPAKVVVFDLSQKTAELTVTYPFGIQTIRVYKLGDIAAPEVKWRSDQDLFNDGFWELIVTFPDRRKISCSATSSNLSEQRIEAEKWRDSIIEIQS